MVPYLLENSDAYTRLQDAIEVGACPLANATEQAREEADQNSSSPEQKPPLQQSPMDFETGDVEDDDDSEENHVPQNE